ncbi:MAG: hypothetical protein FWE34_08375 [Defluviitaleaceae bacterium]|nr:hypothetical protein [Defluviitaleaceae bacterium]
MKESFVIDKNRLYGFDYDENGMWMWAQDKPVTVFEEAAEGIAASDEVIETETEDITEIAESLEEVTEIGAQMDARDAFFEFARGGHTTRPPHGHPHPTPVVPPRPPHPQTPPDHNFDPRSGSAPRFAPPAYVPQRAPGLRAVDPGSISRCLYSNTFVWLNNRQSFWFFPTFIGRRSIAGFRWMHGRWVYMGFSLNMIDSFFCGGR